MTRLAAAAVAISLPLSAMAQGPAVRPGAMAQGPHGGPMMPPPPGGPMMPPPHGMFPHGMPGLAPPPMLHGVELTEPQQDKLFELMLAQAPAERARAKEAAKALDELRRLATLDRFDTDRARSLAETHGRALAQLALMRAELDARLRALLTPEQRKQLDEARARADSHPGAFKRF
jgi:Spy/CpxP family protein refolding chaperone